MRQFQKFKNKIITKTLFNLYLYYSIEYSCSKSSNEYDNTAETDSIDSESFFSDDDPYEMQALKCIISDDYVQGISVFDKALKIDSKNVFALEWRGKLHHMLNNYDQALADLDKALEINPNNSSALLFRSAVHYDLENYKQALVDLNEALEIDPENVSALEYRGAVHYMLDNNSQALIDLNKALEINPSSAFALKYRGVVHYLLNNYKQAQEDLDMALKIDPEDTSAIACRGAANLSYCNMYQDLYSYNQVLKIDPENVPALICRGNVYQMLGNNDRALLDINKALEIDQDNVSALGIRSIVYRNLEKYEQALTDLNKTLEVDPENASSLENRGRVYQKLSNYNDALADLNKSIEIEPECQFALAFRGDLHRTLGNYKESLTDLEKCLKIDPDNSFALAVRGDVNRELGNYEMALSDLNKSLKIDPEGGLALQARGIVHIHLKEYELALADLNTVLKIYQKDDAPIFAIRGEVYKLLNDYDQAKADLDRALKIDPDNIFALITRSQVYELLNNNNQAKADLNKILEINPDHVSALLDRAFINGKLQDYERVLVDTNRILKINKQNKLALLIRGDAHRRLGNYDLARSDFSDALNIDPRDNKLDDFILAHRGIVFSILKDYENALIDLNRAMKINPKIALWHNKNNELYQLLRETLITLIRTDPQEPSALTLRGFLYVMLGYYENALIEIKKALKGNPHYSYALEIQDELCELRKTQGVNATRFKVFEPIYAAFKASADSHRSLSVSTTSFKPCLSECVKKENRFEYCKPCLDRLNKVTLEAALKFAGKKGLCSQCERIITNPNWCSLCDYDRLKNDFSNWTSGNQEIDEFIRELQEHVEDYQGDVIEWIPYARFENVENIGKGGFSQVSKADWLDGKITKWNNNIGQWERLGKMCVALKIIKNSKDEIKEFLNEAKGYLECRNTIVERNVIRIYGFSQDPSTNNYIIVMQYIEGGNLRNFLSKKKDFDMKEKLSILSNIAHGLVTMHCFTSLVHGDFHPGNIFVDKDNNIFIADLGLCRCASNDFDFKPKHAYVVEYTAPEVLHGGINTMESDIYSFGMIMFEIVTGVMPFANYKYSHDELRKSICQGARPKIPVNIPIAFTILMEKCWDNDPRKRPHAGMIDYWFKDTQKAIELYSMSLMERAEHENKNKSETFNLNGFEKISDYIAENFLFCNVNPVKGNPSPSPST
ncbi:tetratricopeptide repeat protein [Rhizophagus clarus]|uniref:Tetratricopeptide repeat protein n=1 Tax=Rhizophagus clarus TaxID=94130 RepID=A0A8H3LTN6_9GLOM|nr:tetratricopeptide repeat protein [Rhizophagus clarus]